jgi:hypothetical protein
MPVELKSAVADKTQRTYARLAGCLFLAVLILAFGGGSILSHVAGSGPSQKPREELQPRNGHIQQRFRSWCLPR